MTNHPIRNHLSQLAFAQGKPHCEGIIKANSADFMVSEKLSFDLDHQGNHVYLYLQKRNLNTIFVAKRLARIAKVKSVAIGYAGLKDKNATTLQWFSVDLSGKIQPDWTQIEDDNLKIVEVTRHSRKLKRGAIASNKFNIVMRALSGDLNDLSRRLEHIGTTGVPNYFGPQRFGHNEQNLNHASALFSRETATAKSRAKKSSDNRFTRGLYLSSARSMLFNQVLSFRVENTTWNCAMQGDAMLLDGTNSFFVPDEIDHDILQRLNEKDIHPTGPLYGQGKLVTTHQVATIENQILANEPLFLSGLEQFNLKMARRSLRLQVKKLHWQHPDQESLELQFELESGSYATSVLRELIGFV